MKLKRAVLLSVMGASILLATTSNQMVAFGQDSDKRMNVNLGIWGLENPTSTAEDSAEWAGSKIYFGDNGDSAWKVLDKNQGSTGDKEQVFLLKDKALEQKAKYHDSFKSVTWENCTLRALLNGANNQGQAGTICGNLFDEQEKKSICETKCVNEDNSTYNTDGGKDTNDLLFLLSSDEANNKDYGFGSDATRNNGEYWWLRTIGYNGSNAGIVYGDGGVFEHGLFTQKEFNVCPAFNLKKSQVFITSASGIAKGDFQVIGDDKVSQNEWKITLNDGNTEFKAQLPETGVAGDKISVNITDFGDKEYTQVSAMILDSDGNTEAYGKIADGKTGEIEIEIPTDLSSGSYQLYVFPENLFAGNTTDYAGNYVLEDNFVIEGNEPVQDVVKEVDDTDDSSKKSGLPTPIKIAILVVAVGALAGLIVLLIKKKWFFLKKYNGQNK